MAEEEQPKSSIHQRIYAILSDNNNRKSFFPSPEQAQEIEELEYQLARAESDLRAAEARVERLRAELAKRCDSSKLPV